MRNRRVQFLPVQWRTSLKLDAEEEELREANGLDNNFSLSGQLNLLSFLPIYPKFFSLQTSL